MDKVLMLARGRWFSILALMVMTILLSSCGSHRVAHGDGPPNFYVDETKVPNAVPRPEKLAKYGNMDHYFVAGKRYKPMKSCKNYKEVGVASWYGTLFHQRKTSSGEPYDMLGMTAAHRTLPLPTYVEVTNLKNNRKIIVKVNDRGPFASNRIIDLSYVAAKKLDMLGRGTTLVRLKAIDPNTYGKPIRFAKKNSRSRFAARNRNRSVASGKGTYLHVGTFREKSGAEKLKHRLSAQLGMPVRINHPDNSPEAFYQVHVGPIKDTATAEKITTQLNGLGIRTNPID